MIRNSSSGIHKKQLRTQYNWPFCYLRCWRSMILGAVFHFSLCSQNRMPPATQASVFGASFKRNKSLCNENQRMVTSSMRGKFKYSPTSTLPSVKSIHQNILQLPTVCYLIRDGNEISAHFKIISLFEGGLIYTLQKVALSKDIYSHT